jgi:dCMP deaminase
MARPSWDEYFFAIAQQIGTRASCLRASVGAVIVSKDNQILSTGYNGAASGEPHCLEVGCLEVDGHCQRTLHAEVNAVAWAARRGVVIEGARIYVHVTVGETAPSIPCRECAKVLRAAGILEIKGQFQVPN